MKVTAVLLKYKREKELKEIISSLKKHSDIIDEILIWDNTKINLCGWGRYFGALEAKNEIIYTQDDDVIVNNIPALFNKYIQLKDNNQEQIVNNITITGKERYDTYNQTLMGWGSLYNKNWIGILNKYIRYYGIDNLFLRDTSRIFTGLFEKWYNVIVEEGKEICSFDCKNNEDALCKQDIHKKNVEISIKRIKRLKGLK